MTNPSELSTGTEVYFEIGTGSVLQGEIVGTNELQKHYPNADVNESNLVLVSIDRETSQHDDKFPSHMAPKKYQPDTEWVFRDAYTIDVEEQHYIVTEETLVEVLN